MEIDTSNMDPSAVAAAQGFAAMVAQLPTEAVELLVELLQGELKERAART